MSHSKTHSKKSENEITERLRKSKIIQDAIYYRQYERGAFHDMDLDDWFWVQKEAERNIFEQDLDP
jgi:hypothetical protein